MRSLLILFFFVSGQLFAKCEEDLDTILNQSYEKFHVIERASNRLVDINENDVVLGINGENKHYYVQVGEYRLDGNILFMKKAVTTKDSKVADGQIIFKALNIDEKKAEKLKKAIIKGNNSVSLTCSQKSLALMDCAGFKVKGRPMGPERLMLVENLKAIIKNGFTDAEGNIIRFEVYTVKGVKLKSIEKDMQDWEKILIDDFVQKTQIHYIVFGITTTGTAVVAYYLVSHQK